MPPPPDLLFVLALAATAAVLVLPVAVTPLIAARKGFKWYFWLLAGSLFGLLVVAILPAANTPGLSEEEQQRRRQKGDRAGSGLTFLTLALIVFQFVSQVKDAFRRITGGPTAEQVEGSFWQSRFHPIRVAYGPPWTMIDALRDSEDRVLAGCIDNADGKSYVIVAEPDVPQAEMTDEEVFDTVREEMLDAHPDNRFIDETDRQFHGALCRRLRFRIQTEKWGTMCTYVHIRRTGERYLAVQWSFPCGEDPADIDRIPPELKELDRGVRLYANGLGDSGTL